MTKTIDERVLNDKKIKDVLALQIDVTASSGKLMSASDLKDIGQVPVYILDAKKKAEVGSGYKLN